MNYNPTEEEIAFVNNALAKTCGIFIIYLKFVLI